MSRILLCTILTIHSLFSVNFIFADAAPVPGQVYPNYNGTVVTQNNGVLSTQWNNSQTATATDTSSTDNILGISANRLRTGDITMKDIPVMIASAVEYLMALAGSIAVVALIYHAVRMQLASGITGDSSWVDKAKRGMKWAGLGFILAMSAWFLMSRLVELLSSL